MFKSGTLTHHHRHHIYLWFALAFNAGTINTGGFMACRRFVSHVTGFATLAGMELAKWDVLHFWGMLSVPLFFLCGVAVAGWLVDRRYDEGEGPHYAITMGLVSGCLLFVTIGGLLGFFGAFGEEMRLQHDFLLMVLLCFSSGLQNGAITTSSGSTIRTTHLSGITTDLGLGLVRIFRHGFDHPKVRSDVRASMVRGGTIASFVLGSFIGGWLYLKIGYGGFLLPTLIAAGSAWLAMKEKDHHHRQRAIAVELAEAVKNEGDKRPPPFRMPHK